MGEKNKLKKLRNRLIAVYTVLGILLLSAGAASIISAAKRSLDKQAESFTSSLTAQLKKSVDNYIVRIEKSSAASLKMRRIFPTALMKTVRNL